MLSERRCVPVGWPAAASGGNPDVAERLAGEAVAAGATRLISFGLAGGLDPALRPGDLVIGSSVVTTVPDLPPVPCCVPSPSPPAPLRPATVAPVLGVDTPAATIVDKARLRLDTGAAIVDMESHRVAGVAQAAGGPVPVAVVVVRVLLDPADQRLPPSALVGLAPDGATRPFAVMRSLIRHPWDLPDLVRLGRQTRLALKALRAAGESLRAQP